MGEAPKAKTNQFAANVLPIIREIQSVGHTRGLGLFNANCGRPACLEALPDGHHLATSRIDRRSLSRYRRSNGLISVWRP